jgi:hypothetical protein
MQRSTTLVDGITSPTCASSSGSIFESEFDIASQQTNAKREKARKFVYLCPFCPKQYFARISLIYHAKSEHSGKLPTKVGHTGRPRLVKRGRPQENSSQERPKVGRHLNHIPYKFISELDDIVYELYQTHAKHPLYIKLAEMQQSINIVQANTSDAVLAEYLLHLAKTLSNPDLKTGIKFTFFYRDFFNRYSNDRSCNECPERLPLQSNSFLVMVKENKLLPLKEAADHTFLFCKWLFENSYSSQVTSYK